MADTPSNAADEKPEESMKAKFKAALEAKQNKNHSGGKAASSQDSTARPGSESAHKAQRFQRKSGG